MAAARVPLGELLVGAGVMTPEALAEVLSAQQETGMPLGRIIVQRGYASADDVATALTQQYGALLRAEFGILSAAPAGEVSWTPAPTKGSEDAEHLQHELDDLRARYAELEAELEQRRSRIERLEEELTASGKPVDETDIPTGDEEPDEGRWRVSVGDPEQCEALRNYCLRLGAFVEVCDDGALETWFADDESNEELGDYLQTWIEANSDTWIEANSDTTDDIVEVEAGAEPTAEPETEAEAESESEPENEVEVEQDEHDEQPSGQLAVQPADPNALAVAAPVDRAGSPVPRGPRLGELLVQKGLITEHQLTMAIYESQNTNTLLGRVLLNKGWVFEDELARCLSEQWGIEYVSLARVGVDRSAVRLLPKQVGLEFATIPVRYTDEGVTVAFADPTDEGAITAVETFVYPFRPVVAVLSDITMFWQDVPA